MNFYTRRYEFSVKKLNNINRSSPDILPSIVYGDTHYNSSENIIDAASKDVELKGPVAPIPGKKSTSKNDGFSVNLAEKTVTCPQGEQADITSQWSDGRVRATIPNESCDACKEMEKCVPEPGGQTRDIETRKRTTQTKTCAYGNARIQDRDASEKWYRGNDLGAGPRTGNAAKPTSRQK